MKKISILASLAISVALAGCTTLGTAALSGAASKAGGNVLSNVLGAATNANTITNALSSILGTDKLTQSQLIGTWKYSGPGCAFTTDKTLAKAGGEVAATQIKEKMAPTYKTLNLTADNTTITFGEDGTYSAKIGGKSVSGKYTYSESDGKIVLQGLLFNANCYAKRSSSGIAILFEAKKLLTLFQVASALSGNKNLEAISEISKNYDGVRLGFEMGQ
ncbi:MAG: DUF4923 family protein [Bacteroidaceae bacterium]|nr:DUF4923 family protein [Bacteroidaceae bacterium]